MRDDIKLTASQVKLALHLVLGKEVPWILIVPTPDGEQSMMLLNQTTHKQAYQACRNLAELEGKHTEEGKI